jgi:carboxymethylenebutenolidase
LLAWLAAARPGLACAVGYYAVGLDRHIASRPQCPVLLHFGKADPSIPAATVQALRSSHPEVQVYEYDAGHAFNRDDDRSFHAPSAQLAWSRTLSFYAKTFQ